MSSCLEEIKQKEGTSDNKTIQICINHENECKMSPHVHISFSLSYHILVQHYAQKLKKTLQEWTL